MLIFIYFIVMINFAINKLFDCVIILIPLILMIHTYLKQERKVRKQGSVNQYR